MNLKSSLTVRAIVFLVVLILVFLPVHQRGEASAVAQNIDDLELLFQNPPDDSRIMMRWWWFGPAVTKTELEREMRLMKEGGIGGFEIQPVYPLAMDDEKTGIRNIPFLSDEFLEAVRFTSEKARELGLRVDLTLGSGWPYGGPEVQVADASGMLRVARVKLEPGATRVAVPDIGTGEKLVSAFLAKVEGQSIAGDSLREITDIRDGAARLQAPTGTAQEALFFISSRTGMQVKRPALGAEGFVLDHLSRTATDNYLKKVGDRLLKPFGSNPPHAVFCDSLEVYNANWEGDLLDEFKKRRGYDLKPYLPALAFDVGPKTAAVRHDWGRTLTELLDERFLARMHEWSNQNKTLFRIQCYGVPAATLASNRYADLSEGEGFRWKTLSATRWASSASHIYGQPVTSSETWTWLHSPVFRATPLDIKAEADLHFLQGINQLIGHGWPYTAEGVEYPGWRFYAAGVFNEKNPWWIVMPDLSRYLQRVSFLLRQGQPANDVAIYLPNDDAWAHFTTQQVHMIDVLRERLGTDLIPRILESGYNFDFFDDDTLKQNGRVENGSLVLRANKYKVVILPNVGQIPLATFEKLEEFARGGGVLVATRRAPSEEPGFKATPSDHLKIADLSRRIFEGPAARGRFVADEKTQLTAALSAGLRPDVSLSPAVPQIGFIHRRTADAEIYFVANTDNVRHKVVATFRVTGRQPEWWDPMTGHVSRAVADEGPDGVSVPLGLEPYESRVLVFSQRAKAASPVPPVRDGGAEQPEIDLSTDWMVSFGDNSPVKVGTLKSWTEDERTRYYSGVVSYEKSFEMPSDFPGRTKRVRLEMGAGKPAEAATLNSRVNSFRALLDPPVAEAAVVFVNGKRAGSVWCPPYSIDLIEFLKPGNNKLRIIVGNTAVNHMAGRGLPDYRLLNLRYGERFQAQDMDKVRPEPSGLLGPVRLVTTEH
ncbi:MAG TPA: glycosyl hydrolase [Blastocatellia bacterium]|nr:glycosyl hydrolase [Blastocatellia bacterium]